MDLASLDDAFFSVAEHQRHAQRTTLNFLDDVLSDVLATKARIEGGAKEAHAHQKELADLAARLSKADALKRVAEAQKETNTVLGKLSKAIDKAFPVDIAKVYREVPCSDAVLSLEILRHLYREGMFLEGDSYAKEASIQGGQHFRDAFERLHRILGDLRRKEVTSALAWVQEHRQGVMLQGDSSHLEFGLHKLQFIHVLTSEGRTAALAYARANFPPFGSSHMTDIQRLMGALLWFDRLTSSPYSDLASPSQWEQVLLEFKLKYLNAMGEATRSPLECTVSAGGQALPMLLKLHGLMAAKPGEWQRLQQLPVEIELGRDFQFHSVFACPVSREQSSAENPPMLLPCCHVLGKLSIMKLARGTPGRPFKCPYCPMETTPDSCKPIHF